MEFLGDRIGVFDGRFDAAPCKRATTDALDRKWISQFIRTARRVRKCSLAEDTPTEAFLKHLNLLNNGRLTNAAVLLFGKSVQRHVPNSEVKCAHFHGTWVSKPIPSYQVYQGNVFDLVDRAADFVLDRIDLSVGTRAESVRAPVSYEMPKEVIIEAIVNAVAHRDYTSSASVQVMLFRDRLEVRNPGTLPTRLTLDELRVPHGSVPANPLLARAMYLVEYAERMGTGTLDMIRRCREAGLPEPEFAVEEGFVTTIRRRRRGDVTPVAGPDGGQAEVERGPSRGQAEVQPRRSGGQAGVKLVRGAKPRSSGGQAGVKPESSEGQAGVKQGAKPVRGAKPKSSGGSRGQAGAKPGEEWGETLPRASAQDSAAEPSLSVRDVGILRAAVAGPASRKTLLTAGRYSRRSGSFGRRIRRLVGNGLLEMTLPEKPTSPAQRYRLTAKGQAALTVAESSRKRAVKGQAGGQGGQ